ncbi:MAG: hypothetical protein QM736_17855 [Vicinamibacterales bacterium]
MQCWPSGVHREPRCDSRPRQHADRSVHGRRSRHAIGGAFVDLGNALAALSSRVTRRELELSRLFEQIARERNVLLDTVLGRLHDGFHGCHPVRHPRVRLRVGRWDRRGELLEEGSG